MAVTALLESPAQAALVQQVRDAYTKQPTLCLTLAQARRLFGLDVGAVEDALHALVEDRFLQVTPHALFVRSDRAL